MSVIPMPFFVIDSAPEGNADEKFVISQHTQFAAFQGAKTEQRALAVFPTLKDAQRYARGRITNGAAIPIRTTIKAIEFLGEVQDKCGIRYLIVDTGDEHAHSTTRKALEIDSAIRWLRSQFEGN